MDELRFAVTLLAALGSGLVAGVFFAFSTSVMKALTRIPAPQGIAAMQSINVVIVNPVFLLVFVGTGMLSLAALVLDLIEWSGLSSVFVVVGSALYVIGSFVVTGAANITRNDALDRVDATSAEGAGYWSTFVPQWIGWNNVRLVASLLACAAFILALLDY